MKSIRYKLQAFCSEHILYVSYRWLTWILAIASWALFRIAPEHQPIQLWMLLVLTGIINIALTAFAQRYIQLTRRWPPVLMLDIIASVGLVWLGGGGFWPFFPYALGALVLPSVRLNRREAILMAILFVAFDMLLRLNRDTPTIIELWWYGGLPMVFMLCCTWIPWLAQRVVMLPFTSTAALPGRSTSHPLSTDEADQAIASHEQGNPAHARTERSPERVAADMSIAAQLTTIRSSYSGQKPMQALLDAKPDWKAEFPEGLQRLVARFHEQSDISIRVVVAGQVRPLRVVEHITLFKLAQEALLNIQQHAHAHSALLSLDYQERAIMLSVYDDGVGLLDGTYRRPGVHALQALSYRLAELDGLLEVFDGEHGGVTVRGTLPFEGP